MTLLFLWKDFFFYQNKQIHLNHNCLLCARKTRGRKKKRKLFQEVVLPTFLSPGICVFTLGFGDKHFHIESVLNNLK